MNRRNFIRRASIAMAALGLPGFRPKSPPADVVWTNIPYAWAADLTKNMNVYPDMKLIFEVSNEIWNGEPLVRLLGSTEDVEKWSVSYIDPRTNTLVIQKGECVG